MRIRLASLALLIGSSLCGCVSLPQGLSPIENFEAARYSGQWYEIARLDHRFERGLSRVTASYELLPAGGLSVINRGFDARRNKWRQASGRAHFIKSESVGWLKVSFFRPFYASYVIIALDPNYRWAMVSGPSRDYFWILSRSPALEPDVLQALIKQAARQGFAVERLIFTHQG